MANPSIRQELTFAITLKPSKLSRTLGPSRTSVKRPEPYSSSCLPARSLSSWDLHRYLVLKRLPGNRVSFRRSAADRRTERSSTHSSTRRTCGRDCRSEDQRKACNVRSGTRSCTAVGPSCRFQFVPRPLWLLRQSSYTNYRCFAVECI